MQYEEGGGGMGPTQLQLSPGTCSSLEEGEEEDEDRKDSGDTTLLITGEVYAELSSFLARSSMDSLVAIGRVGFHLFKPADP